MLAPGIAGLVGPGFVAMAADFRHKRGLRQFQCPCLGRNFYHRDRLRLLFPTANAGAADDGGIGVALITFGTALFPAKNAC